MEEDPGTETAPALPAASLVDQSPTVPSLFAQPQAELELTQQQTNPKQAPSPVSCRPRKADVVDSLTAESIVALRGFGESCPQKVGQIFDRGFFILLIGKAISYQSEYCLGVSNPAQKLFIGDFWENYPEND